MTEHIPSTAVWGDGGGSTLWATLEAVHDGRVQFEIDTVLTAEPQEGIFQNLERAKSEFGMDIKPVVLEHSHAHKRQSQEAQDELLRVLDDNNIYNLTLMGCMVIIGSDVVIELNGDQPEAKLPLTPEEAQKLLVPGDEEFGHYLPADFPDTSGDTDLLRLMNTHPAPTIVTANTWGVHATRRMVNMRSRQSAVTFHGVGITIDTGLIAAAHIFPLHLPPLGASETEQQAAAEAGFANAQRVEKAYLPLDVNEHLYNQQRRLRAA